MSSSTTLLVRKVVLFVFMVVKHDHPRKFNCYKFVKTKLILNSNSILV